MLEISFRFGLRSKSLLVVVLSAAIFIVYFQFYAIPKQDSYATEKLIQATEKHLQTLASALVSPLLKMQYATLHEELDSQLHQNKHWKSLSLVTVDDLRIYPLIPTKVTLAIISAQV